jgi:hypothetical protein
MGYICDRHQTYPSIKFNQMKGTTMSDVETVNTSTGEIETVHTSATDVATAIQGLNTGAAFYSSLAGAQDFATRKLVASALTSSVPLDENIGKTIALTNFIVQPVELVQDDGSVNTAPRVILIDKDGKGYHATSIGMLTSIRNILASLGEPSSWPEPVNIQVVKVKANRGSFMTIKFV